MVATAPLTRRFRRSLRRAGRRTNLAILLLLAGELLTGGLLFAAGTPAPATAARIAHGLVGVGLVVLVPWKTAIIWRASRLQVASIVLLVLVLTCLVSGFVEVFGGYGVLLGLSPIQVHVGAALVLVFFLVVHAARHWPVSLRRSDLSRRRLLVTGTFTLGAGAVYGAAELTGRLTRSPAASRLSTGSHALAPADIPATIWLFDRVPDLDPAVHRVDVSGRPLGRDDLEALGGPVRARLDCTSGWYADATWTGVALSDLLDPDALAGARSVEVRSVTGYSRRFPPAEASRLWLATGLEGTRLDAGQGAPVRLVAPGRRGFWWVKWVASVTLSDVPAAATPPFPLQ
ncbi:molybdopterin-dependent oxidoreductase [uncultured Friedmanniella sp.]|uniref:molybdopterin-dependent oxidoreductase n=1 Tax=uncultured Friedmanniella sp. TaxID=335381 RepID=UPI0035C99975